MNETQIHELVTLQRQYFLTNATLNIDFRIHALKKLQAVILKMKSRSSRLSKRIWARADSNLICVKPVWF